MAHELHAETDFPKKASKRPRTVEEKTILVIRDENRTAIRKRPDRGLLAGMYEFPSMEGFCTAEEVTAYLAQNGIRTLRIQPLAEAKHIFTHKEWHMKGYMVRVDELDHGAPGKDSKNWLYIHPEETRDGYPIPSAFSAYTGYLSIRLGQERYQEEQHEAFDSGGTLL
jgi:adenine-specific DNA glycosylase